MEIKVKTNKGVSILQLSGDLIIDDADALKDALQKAVNEGNQIRIVMENVTALDISVIQLIQSAKKTLGTAHHKLSVQTQLPDDLKSLLEKSGINLEA